jgi:hypothetical protein
VEYRGSEIDGHCNIEEKWEQRTTMVEKDSGIGILYNAKADTGL